MVRGDALRILNTVGKIRTSEVNRIYRQEVQSYREAVEDLAKGSVKAGFEKLDDAGFIKEIDPMKPNEQLVNDYVTALKKGKTALVISPTHKQGEKVTEDIRNSMRKKRMLGKKEVDVSRYTNTNLTEAQRQDVRNFKDGQVVQFNQNTGDFTPGSLWTIHQDKEGSLVLKGTNGNTAPLPLDQANRFEVFDKSEIGLSSGDRVQITKTA